MDSALCIPCLEAAQAKSAGPSQKIGDPVDIPSGFLTESETDYSTADGLLSVKRTYVSSSFREFADPPAGFGEAWRGLIPGRLYIRDSSMNNIFYSEGNGTLRQLFQPNEYDHTAWAFASSVSPRAKLSMVSLPSLNRDAYFNQAPVLNGPAEFKLDFANGETLLYRRSDIIGTYRYAVPIEHDFPSG